MYHTRRRKPNRLRDFDYSQSGWYFVTICVQNRECLFGRIENGKMILNQFGEIVEKCWYEIPQHFPDVTLDEFVVMPNHVHGMVVIRNDVMKNRHVVGNAYMRSLQSPSSPDRTKMALSKIIHGFKSAVTREINKIQNQFCFQWQKSFHDHIIRNEKSYWAIKEYIRNNPAHWTFDEENPLYLPIKSAGPLSQGVKMSEYLLLPKKII